MNEADNLQKQKGNGVLPCVSHSNLEKGNTYWCFYDNKWQPTMCIAPYKPDDLYFRFLNGMMVSCKQIKEIKPLCYCG